MASAVAATWVAGMRHHGVALATAGPGGVPALPPVLSARQRRDLDALTALILPTDETPGAREARVVDFIDRGLASFASDQRALFEQGLTDLGTRVAMRHSPGAAFADLDVAAQRALAQELDSEKSDFFGAVRIATITGLLANPEYGGNAGKVGWQLIGFQDQFGWQPPFGDYDRESSPE
jgi:gluconate 2-dehydrogenase gamma chain